jgi:hypothetical protein
LPAASILLWTTPAINYCVVVDDDGKVGWTVIQFEPRVARVERAVDEHTQVIGGLKEAVAGLDQRVCRLEDRMDRGFERVDRRFDAIEEKMSRHFRWQTGILLSSLIAMMGTLGGIIAVLIRRA